MAKTVALVVTPTRQSTRLAGRFWLKIPDTHLTSVWRWACLQWCRSPVTSSTCASAITVMASTQAILCGAELCLTFATIDTALLSGCVTLLPAGALSLPVFRVTLKLRLFLVLHRTEFNDSETALVVPRLHAIT